MRVKNMRVVKVFLKIFLKFNFFFYMQKDIISKEHKELADLLTKMLELDPSKRIDCETALKHPFFSIKYKKLK